MLLCVGCRVFLVCWLADFCVICCVGLVVLFVCVVFGARWCSLFAFVVRFVFAVCCMMSTGGVLFCFAKIAGCCVVCYLVFVVCWFALLLVCCSLLVAVVRCFLIVVCCVVCCKVCCVSSGLCCLLCLLCDDCGLMRVVAVICLVLGAVRCFVFLV